MCGVKRHDKEQKLILEVLMTKIIVKCQIEYLKALYDFLSLKIRIHAVTWSILCLPRHLLATFGSNT